MSKLKAQLNAVLIVVVILIFTGVILLLFSFAGSVEKGEYMNTYTHNLLVSSLRASTGHSDKECDSISNAIACSFLQTEDYLCKGTSTLCSDLAKNKILENINVESVVVTK